MKNLKIYLKRDWKKFEIYAKPSNEHGMQKIDEDGNIVEWVTANKRVEAKIIRK